LQRRLSTALTAIALSTGACGSAEGSPAVDTQRPALRNGQPAAADHAAVVLVRAAVDCTGTLVAPNLVLTVAHCLAEHEQRGFSCLRYGQLDGTGAGRLTHPVAPETIQIFGNASSDSPLAVGKAVFHPALETVGCSNDYALIELDRRLDIPPLSIDLQFSIKAGDVVQLVGHGARDSWSVRLVENEISARVLAVGTNEGQTGPDTTYPGTLLLEAGVCPGDSGGPVIVPELGRVVAVLGKREKLENSDCLDPRTRGLATHLRDYAERISAALSAANPEAGLPQPEPAADPGTGCAMSQAPKQGAWMAWLMLMALARRRRAA
jgi:MYXO-CTERM domain-containing protein